MAVSATRLIRPYKADTATMYCIVATFLLVLGFGFKHMVKGNCFLRNEQKEVATMQYTVLG